jgi:hypothetical protein
MLFNNLNLNRKTGNISESNFLSSDFFGIIDSDAESKLANLTVDKMFEGLDLEKSAELHDFIEAYAPSMRGLPATSSVPSTSDVMGLQNAKKSAFEVINSQLHYMQIRLESVEKNLDTFYKNIEQEYSKTITKEELEKSVSAVTGAENIASIVPKINDIVKDYVKKGLVNFENTSTKQAFLTLHKLKINNYIQAIKENIYKDAMNVSVLPLYRKIDSLPLEEITNENATLSEIRGYMGNPVDLSYMYKSFDPIARISAFLEECLMQYEYGIDIKKIFGTDYTISANSADVLPIGILKKFVKSIDISVFEPMEDLLYDVSFVLLERVYIQNPDEDDKNIFVPSLQFMFISMLSLLAFKLINYNLTITTASVKREERIKTEEERLKKEKEKLALEEEKTRLTKFYDAYKQLNNLNFFTGKGLVYKKESRMMLPEIVKLINNFFVYLNYLDISKLDSPVFDESTHKAVIDFQTENRLVLIDGKIGRETKGAMQKVATLIKDTYKII